jgi:methylthioribulose-1-phosphate dehydratase
MDHALLAQDLAQEARRLAALGLMACTAGNLSARMGGADGDLLVSPSGVDKGDLSAESFIRCTPEGRPREPGRRPSDETRLHAAIYRATGCGAVVHGHGIHAVALGLRGGDRVAFTGIEMLKAFAGTTTHACTRTIPIVENDQDMDPLAARVLAARDAAVPAVVVRGHGVYAWGRTVAEAGRHLETVEWLCRLRLLTGG